MAFELASTNLVAELSIILIVLMGWQFALAEFAGGPLMVAIVAVLFRLFLSRKLVKQAKEQADKGIKGAMEGHAEMDMSVEGRSFWQHISSPERCLVWQSGFGRGRRLPMPRRPLEQHHRHCS